jgi:hypothetical protein
VNPQASRARRFGLAGAALVVVACAPDYELPCPDGAPSAFDGSAGSAPALHIDLELSDRSRHPATFAVWQLDSTGEPTTVYATCKAAHDAWDGGGARPEALPVWSGVRDDPDSIADLEIDAITTATPTHAFEIVTDLPTGEIDVRVEANVSFDSNTAYPQDPNGQPSLVWGARVSSSMTGAVDMDLLGHGSPDGASAALDDDVSGITTAADIVAHARLSVR